MYTRSGHIIYAKEESETQGSLWAVPFDPERMVLTGEPVLIQSAVSGRGASFAVGPTGPIAYRPEQGPTTSSLQIIEPGKPPRLLDDSLPYETPRFSNDGGSIAVFAFDAVKWMETWIFSAESGAGQRITAGIFPLWTPDDDAIVYAGESGLYKRPSDGSSPVEKLVDHDRVILPIGWVDGETLVYQAVAPQVGSYLRTLTTEGEEATVAEISAAVSLSPDGKWLAFCPWGQDGLLVGRFPGLETRRLIDRHGCMPRWRGTDKLYYERAGAIWAVEVDLGDVIKVGTPERIVQVMDENASGAWGTLFDVDETGRLAITYQTTALSRPPVLLVNWQVLLEE
jgi:hypothetical protein